MQRCKSCGRRMARDDTGQQEWCRDIRSLFVLGEVLPEDYHPNCFLNALIEHRLEPVPTPGPTDSAPEPQLATAESQPPGWW